MGEIEDKIYAIVNVKKSLAQDRLHVAANVQNLDKHSLVTRGFSGNGYGMSRYNHTKFGKSLDFNRSALNKSCSERHVGVISGDAPLRGTYKAAISQNMAPAAGLTK